MLAPLTEKQKSWAEYALGSMTMRPVAQRAAVKAWLGEIPIEGKCPVRLPKTRIRRWEFQD